MLKDVTDILWRKNGNSFPFQHGRHDTFTDSKVLDSIGNMNTLLV